MDETNNLETMSDTPRSDQNGHFVLIRGELKAVILLETAREIEREVKQLQDRFIERTAAYEAREIKRIGRSRNLESIIKRASRRFFHDGPDGETAAAMLEILGEINKLG